MDAQQQPDALHLLLMELAKDGEVASRDLVNQRLRECITSGCKCFVKTMRGQRCCQCSMRTFAGKLIAKTKSDNNWSE